MTKTILALTILIIMGTILSCDKNLKRPYKWCIYHEGKCQYKDKKEDREMKDGDWVLSASERLAIETYIIIKEEEVQACQEKN